MKRLKKVIRALFDDDEPKQIIEPSETRQLKNQVEYLVRTIRDMDQELWNMGQRSDWPSMRPYFVKLQEGMIARKHAENERINDIIRSELIETYQPKQLERK